MNKLSEIGILGLASLVAVGTVAFIAIYGFIHNPDAQLTHDAATVSFVSAGAILAAAGKFFGGGDSGNPAAPPPPPAGQ